MSKETPSQRIVTKIPPPLQLPRLTRVVIYARVSSIHEAQESSLEAQISYFKRMAKEKNWLLIDIYAEKRSAKDKNNRPKFIRMIMDSYTDIFDLILTKSIARFGRDTVETLEALRRLKDNRVDVFFDLENLHSIDDRNTHLITVLEAYAQEENRMRSENIRWGIEKSLEKTDSKLYQRVCFGYQLGPQGVLVIKEEEARIVRRIYQLYLDGYSVVAIVRELERQGIPSPTGRARWSKRTIDMMLSNEKYTGRVIRGKTFIDEYPNAKRRRNQGEVKQFHLCNSHLPIISEEQFAEVQTEKQHRSNLERDGEGVKRRATHYSMKRRQIEKETNDD